MGFMQLCGPSNHRNQGLPTPQMNHVSISIPSRVTMEIWIFTMEIAIVAVILWTYDSEQQ